MPTCNESACLNTLTSVSPEADELRRHLAQQLGHLRFTTHLEQPFLAHLRATQRISALFTVCAVSLVWMFYAVLDVWRLHELQGTGFEQTFFWRSVVLRWLVFVCFACTLYTTLRSSAARSDYEFSIAGSVLACAMAIAASSYTLKSIGMPETSVVMVLMVSVAFFPLGVRLRVMAPIAVAVCAVVTVAGPLLLQRDDHLLSHWVLSAVIWVTFVLSGVTAYYREKGLREQFLLRRLLNWEASHDALTGLANRRMFHEHLDLCMRQAHRQRDALALVILDIDHFKLYNDHYGHLAGDAILREVAALLRKFAQRPLDLAVRLGGEEFALVIYGMPVQDLQRHLAQLQAQLCSMHMAHAVSPVASHVTVSMGAVSIGSEDSQDSAIQRADGLLYQAKRQGRNQACIQGSHRNSCPEQQQLDLPV